MKILDVIEHKSTITYKENLFEQSQGMTSVNLNFPIGEIFSLDGTQGNKFGIGLGNNEVIEFETKGGNTARQQAETFLQNFREQKGLGNDAKLDAGDLKAAARQATDVNVRDFSKFKDTLKRRAAAASATNYAMLEKIGTKGVTLNTILASPFWKGFFKILGAVAFPIAAYANAIEIINDLENEAEAESDQTIANEKRELRNILVAQLSAQVIFVLYLIFRNATLFKKALNGIKWTVRAAQGATAATGVGAVPSVLSLLITESGWLIAGWVISSATVQRALAEWIHGSMFKGIFNMAGAAIVTAAGALDSMLDGAFGTRALRRDLGWDEKSEGAADKEVESSSAWAKLVFKGLLFPEKKKLLVPYMSANQRSRALEQKFGINQQPAPAPAPAPADPNTPGPQ